MNTFIDFVVNDLVMYGIKPRARLLAIGTLLFDEYCPTCSEVYLENCDVSDSTETVKQNVVG